jgi:RNase adaptor protein for sRNA GlmZ degradation
MLPGHDMPGLLVRVAVGSADGRQRSVVVATVLAYLLVTAGIGVDVSHRDIQRALPEGG